jgi:putative acetyltransferase
MNSTGGRKLGGDEGWFEGQILMDVSMRIRTDDLSGAEIIGLLKAHLDYCRASSPPESVHALDLDGLRAKNVTFWSIWDGPDILGCGALKQLDPSHGEIKSMHTKASARGKGVAAAVVRHIITEGRARGYRRISLETGANAAFAPARALYASFGFVPTDPFADYRPDPNSVFMALDLAG